MTIETLKKLEKFNWAFILILVIFDSTALTNKWEKPKEVDLAIIYIAAFLLFSVITLNVLIWLKKRK